MKRIFSIMLAAAMMSSMAVCAFAETKASSFCVTGIYDKGYLLDDDDSRVDFKEEADDSVPYGETVYYPLVHNCGYTGDTQECTHEDPDDEHHSETYSGDVAVYESLATKSIKIKTDWDEGKSYIDKISVVKKKYTNGSEISDITFVNDKYCYFLAIKTKSKSSTTTATNDVDGTISLKKTSGNTADKFDYDDDVEIDVNFEVGYTQPDDSNTIPKTPALFKPDEDFDEDSEENFDFEADDNSFFVVNTNSQKKLVLGMDNEYDDDIAELYPEAELYFFNGNGGRFNKIGYLHIYDDDLYKYAYSVNDNGKLESVKVTHEDDCLVIRTRTIGRYVLSDVKLKIDEPDEEDDETAVIFDNDTQTNHNPGTGGWGFDDIAYNGWGDTQTVTAAPAVTTAESKAEPAAPAESEKADSKTDSGSEKADKSDKKEAKVEKTAANSPVDVKADTVKINSSVEEEGLNTRAMLLICCCVGAGASALGLIFCLFAAISKSKNDY